MGRHAGEQVALTDGHAPIMHRPCMPQRNVHQAAGVMPWLESADTYKVTEDEFRQCMATMTTLVEDEELEAAVGRLMAQGLPSNPVRREAGAASRSCWTY